MRDVQPPGAAEVQALTLISFANDLVLGGAGGKGTCSILELKTTFFTPRACDTVEGEATLLRRDDAVSIWQSNLRASDGTPLAQVSHTLLEREDGEDATIVEPVPAPDGKPAPAANADSRRETIARAACQVIAEKGFAAASMREIARAAGMHVPTMYQYVASKEEVLELVYLWVFQRIRGNIGDAFASDAPPAERLLGVIRSMIDNNDTMHRESGVLNREMRSLSRPARQRVIDDYAEIVGKIADIIAEGMEDGRFRETDPVLIANFIDGLCDIWSLRQFAVGRVGVDAFKDEMEKFIQFGLAGGPRNGRPS